ncbi:MAG: hypothetical protein J1E62_02700 [Lachnospiraceae bacterium]|nr:hypothetical protein [Lachnospiraceae bacterium]
MQVIVNNVINHHVIISNMVIFMGYLLGIYMLFFSGKKWRDYVICIYGGVLFGWIPSLYITENVIIAGVCCLFLSIILVQGYNVLMEKKIYIPFWIVSFQALLIAGVALFRDPYENNRILFFILSAFLSIALFLILSMLWDFTSENRYFVYGLFGIMEIVGSVFQHYRNDYSSFSKFLGTKNDDVSIFFYMFKLDFGIYDYQYSLVMCMILSLAGYLLCYMLGRKAVRILFQKNLLKLKKEG